MIIEQLPLGPLQANCYLLGCATTRDAVVIDPGAEAGHILQRVEHHGFQVKYVLLTHAHFDHIAAVAEVVAVTGAPLAMHQADLPLLESGGGAELFGLPRPPYKAPDQWLSAGDEVRFGEHCLEVRFTPGHAPGHISFYEADLGVVFDGDVLFAGSIGRTDLPGGNLTQLMHSIQQALLTLPDHTQVFSGHGPATTIGQERRNNPFLQ